MEVFFVYGLVLLFFILAPLFVVAVLSKHPYTDPAQDSLEKTGTTRGEPSQQNRPSTGEQRIAYGLLAVFFIGLCLLAVLGERRQG